MKYSVWSIVGFFLTLSSFILYTLYSIPTAFARITPNDIYQENRSNFQTNLNKIPDPNKKQLVIESDRLLQTINLDICSNLQNQVNKMAAILDEEKRRQKITSTRIAYGVGNTPMDDAEYFVNFAQEAIAYQKSQDYTPQISGSLKAGVVGSLNNLLSDLNILQGKVLKAKSETQTALDYYEK